MLTYKHNIPKDKIEKILKRRQTVILNSLDVLMKMEKEKMNI